MLSFLTLNIVSVWGGAVIGFLLGCLWTGVMVAARREDAAQAAEQAPARGRHRQKVGTPTLR